jgi:hypothetical protein
MILIISVISFSLQIIFHKAKIFILLLLLVPRVRYNCMYVFTTLCTYTLESYVICLTAVTLVSAIFHVGISNALILTGMVDKWLTVLTVTYFGWFYLKFSGSQTVCRKTFSGVPQN